MFSVPHRVILTVLLSAAATYQLTRAERTTVPRNPAKRARFAARAICMVTVAAGLVTTLAAGLLFPTVCLASASIVMDIAYLRHLAERVPDERLAAASQSIAWALGTCCALIALCSVGLELATLLGTATLEFGTWLFLLPCFAMIVVPIAGIVCFALLGNYALVIRKQIAAGSAKPGEPS